MTERTEEQIFRKQPIMVTLGDTEYGLKPLTRPEACKWRDKLAHTMSEIIGAMSAEESQNSIGPAMTAALIAFPDKVAELLFAWQTDLPKDKVNHEATEEQISFAFSRIMVMAYPFLAPLKMTMQAAKSQLS